MFQLRYSNFDILYFFEIRYSEIRNSLQIDPAASLIQHHGNMFL